VRGYVSCVTIIVAATASIAKATNDARTSLLNSHTARPHSKDCFDPYSRYHNALQSSSILVYVEFKYLPYSMQTDRGLLANFSCMGQILHTDLLAVIVLRELFKSLTYLMKMSYLVPYLYRIHWIGCHMMCALWHKSRLDIDMAIEGTHFPFTPVLVHVEPIPLFVQEVTYWTHGHNEDGAISM
jgi:hypothetical protein